MTPRQQFKAAFIARCVDNGLTTAEQIVGHIKQAAGGGFWPLMAWEGGADSLKGLSGLGEAVAKPLMWGALAAPPVAGLLAGSIASKATDADDFDVNEAKKMEVVDEYHRQAERLRREGALRRFSAGNSSGPGSRYML